MSDSAARKLLALLDTACPGLEGVAASIEAGDEQGAVKALVSHFRSRTAPHYLFDRKSAVFLNDPTVLEDAEKTLRHYIYGYQFDGPIVWDFNPTAATSRDNEWTWSLSRTIYWQPLARAYAMTGDGKYVREFTAQLKSFYAAWPAEAHIKNEEFEIKTPFPGHAWRPIEAAIRIYTAWLPCMEIFRESPDFDEDAWVTFLLSVHDHGALLLDHYSNHNRSSNWLSMECSALLEIAVMFPEFKLSGVWKKAGYQRVMHEIPYCFDQDGVHMERTPVYHMVASIAFLQAVTLCRLNAIPVPDYAMAMLEKTAEFLLRIVKPDFRTPMIGDADREDLRARRADTSIYEGMNLSFFTDDLNEIRAYFRWMHNLTGRDDFLFLATGGKEGTAPAINDSKLNESGYYITRTGFGEDEDYMLLDMVKLERGEKSSHSHNDSGHIELMLKGEDILIDCGRYIYNSSCWKDWRHYFLSAAAHNTLFIDDHEMGTVPGVTRVRGTRGFCHEFTVSGRYRLIDISHNGYVYRSDPVFHRRQAVLVPEESICAVIDYVTGPGLESHDIRFYWNYASDGGKIDEGRVSYTTPKGVSYGFTAASSNGGWSIVMLTGSEEPKGGWASFGYPVRVPVSQAVVSQMTSAPFVMVSVIAPLGMDVRISVTMDGASITAGNTVIDASCEGVNVR